MWDARDKKIKLLKKVYELWILKKDEANKKIIKGKLEYIKLIIWR